MGDANGKPSHSPCLRDVLVTRLDSDLKQYNDKFAELLWEIFRYLVYLRQIFQCFHSPFTVKASDVLVDIQLEIIDLKYNADLKGKFASIGLDTSYQYLLPGYPKLTALAAKILCIFRTTCLWEQIFLVLTISKTKMTF